MEALQTDAVAVKGPETPNLFPKMRESLERGVSILTRQANEIDYRKDGAEIEAQAVVAKARDARDIARRALSQEGGPYSSILGAIVARWKPLEVSFEGLRERGKSIAMQALKARQEREAEARRVEQAKLEEARKAEAEAAAKVKAQDTPDALQRLAESRTELRIARASVDSLPPAGAPVGVISDSGSLKPRKTPWRFEVKDLTAVPREFLMLSEGLVRAAIKDHQGDDPPTIAGLRFWRDDTLVDRQPRGVR